MQLLAAEASPSKLVEIPSEVPVPTGALLERTAELVPMQANCKQLPRSPELSFARVQSWLTRGCRRCLLAAHPWLPSPLSAPPRLIPAFDSHWAFAGCLCCPQKLCSFSQTAFGGTQGARSSSAQGSTREQSALLEQPREAFYLWEEESLTQAVSVCRQKTGGRALCWGPRGSPPRGSPTRRTATPCGGSCLPAIRNLSERWSSPRSVSLHLQLFLCHVLLFF